jgi:hemoglobin-like flavoprotein
MRSCHRRPTLVLDSDALTCMTPEWYEGRAATWASDQYHLGLLGLELLNGAPPIDVQCFSDLERKRDFFESPRHAESSRTYFDELGASEPALSFILAKTLERNPEDRWRSMQDLSTALAQVARGGLPDRLRAIAKREYCELLRGNTSFFQAFYDRFFQLSPRARELFNVAGAKLEDQYRKLDRAMIELLNFHANEEEPSPLSIHAETHSRMDLEEKDFLAFREVFLTAFDKLPRGVDDYSKDVWCAILTTGLGYMAKHTFTGTVVVRRPCR